VYNVDRYSSQHVPFSTLTVFVSFVAQCELKLRHPSLNSRPSRDGITPMPWRHRHRAIAMHHTQHVDAKATLQPSHLLA